MHLGSGNAEPAALPFSPISGSLLDIWFNSFLFLDFSY